MKSACQYIVAISAIVTLCACSNDPQAQGSNGGDVSKSSMTFYSKTPSDSEPTVMPLAIAGITCDVDSDTRQVRIDLGEEGDVLVRDDHRLPEPAWLIVVDLTRLDILGGKRDTIMPSRAREPFEMDPAGNIQGAYGFSLHGDLKGQYGLEMEIFCQGG